MTNLNKTVVTECKITRADLHSRTRIAKFAAAAVIVSPSLVDCELLLLPGQNITIAPIQTLLIIICSAPITISVLAPDNSVTQTILVNDQLTLNGTITNNITLSTLNTAGSQVHYICN